MRSVALRWVLFALALVLCITFLTGRKNNAYRSAFTDGLPPDLKDAESEFRRRVLDRFPPGTTEEEVSTSLRLEGFARHELEARSDKPRVWHSLERRGLVCTSRWQVSYARREHSVEDLEATYGVVCP